MSTGYKITDQEAVYFCTFTVVQWAGSYSITRAGALAEMVG